MRISDWSSDVFSSDLSAWWRFFPAGASSAPRPAHSAMRLIYALSLPSRRLQQRLENLVGGRNHLRRRLIRLLRSEEHTSELQSLMRISYAVFFLKKKQALRSSFISFSNYTDNKEYTLLNT